LHGRREAEGFYNVHRERPFFGSLTQFMSSGPIVAMVLEGEGAIAKVRELMGATDPAKAAPGTIRGDLASSIEQNVVHGSDSPESAAYEIPTSSGRWSSSPTSDDPQLRVRLGVSAPSGPVRLGLFP